MNSIRKIANDPRQTCGVVTEKINTYIQIYTNVYTRKEKKLTTGFPEHARTR